jgi:hypothetical protein
MDTQTRYPVKHYWNSGDTRDHWDQMCIWSVEHFGLPGDRYTTEIDEQWMIWYFKNEQDQLLMTLAWGNDGL